MVKAQASGTSDDAVSEDRGWRTMKPNTTGEPAPRVQIQLCVEARVGRVVLATAARLLFEEGFAELGGELRDRLLARPVLPGDVPGQGENRDQSRWMGQDGDVWAECEVDFTADDSADGFWRAAYTEENWRRLLALLDPLPVLAEVKVNVLRRLPHGVVPSEPSFGIAAQVAYHDDGQWYAFTIDAPSESLFASGEREAALIRFVRKLADLLGPTYGDVAPGQGLLDLSTAVERELGLFAWESVRTSRTVLRGYSWLTIVAQEIGDRLGGVDGLTATGAFARVERLASGGYWLLATERFADYGFEAAQRVREALALALPSPGSRPEPGEAVGRAVLSAVPLRDNPMHATAIALRLQTLADAYPDAVIWGSTLLEPYADLVAWGCEPGRVWVWTFAPDDVAASITDRWITAGLSWAADQSLSTGMEVVTGPAFARLFGARSAAQDGSTVSSPDMLVTVRDSDRDGLQTYRWTEQDVDSPAANERLKVSLAAATVAGKRRRQALAAIETGSSATGSDSTRG